MAVDKTGGDAFHREDAGSYPNKPNSFGETLLETQWRAEEAVLRVHLPRRMDFDQVFNFKKQIYHSIDEYKPRVVIVDLKRVEYVDSHLISAFLELQNSLRQIDARLRLANLFEAIRKTIFMMALDNVFETIQD